MPTVYIGENPRLEAVHEDKHSDLCVIITHPHSLMGGNMHNNVVMAARQASLDKGLSSVRFNFRGVGRSSGSFDEGNGEMDDLASVISYVQEPAIIIGYSFGAWVAARLMKRLDNPLPCIYVSPPTAMFAFPSLKQDLVWAITGEADQFCSIPVLENLLDKDRLTVVKHADHFWFGKEEQLAAYLEEKLDLLLQGTE
ncbi:MAG TPA: alpha/beta fold hydrolase [Desulfomonilia bacterium]|nr:alpha/beta fold hydrolase [Desulfomonilia bacterium]